MSSTTAKPWTDEETADAARQAAMGASYHEIGLSLGRTSSAVHGQLTRRGMLPTGKSGRLRPCLCCGRDFNSLGAGNRLCTRCKSQPDPGDAMRYV